MGEASRISETDAAKLRAIGEIISPKTERKEWNKTPEEIVAAIDNDTGVDWDEESNLINLSQFIQENCDQVQFEEFIRRVANEQVAAGEEEDEDWRNAMDGAQETKQ
jgi:hypothetical protein